jgi:hypothetical protein
VCSCLLAWQPTAAEPNNVNRLKLMECNDGMQPVQHSAAQHGAPCQHTKLCSATGKTCGQGSLKRTAPHRHITTPQSPETCCSHVPRAGMLSLSQIQLPRSRAATTAQPLEAGPQEDRWLLHSQCDRPCCWALRCTVPMWARHMLLASGMCSAHSMSACTHCSTSPAAPPESPAAWGVACSMGAWPCSCWHWHAHA